MKPKYDIMQNGDKTWAVEQPTDHDIIYCADMCPCDDMHNYKEIDRMPTFVKEDTCLFDTEEAHTVIQVATHYGWAIVAKWGNNGSTRIYGLKPEVVMDAAAILGGPCDSGDCTPAYGEYIVKYKFIHNETDRNVFLGIDIFEEMIKEEKKNG